MQFIADAMLGRLARWLRFLGFDTLYYRDITDNKLINIAREQDRFLLTRDTRLIKRKGLRNYLLIKDNNSYNQLLQVLEELDIREFNSFSRCVACNGKLIKITDKMLIKDAVPEHVFLYCKEFFRCNDCGKIYWEGSHRKKFKENLYDLLKKQ